MISNSVRAIESDAFPKIAPMNGMSRRSGIPLLALVRESLISPPSATVSPSCIATE